jgi:hypothetical protein
MPLNERNERIRTHQRETKEERPGERDQKMKCVHFFLYRDHFQTLRRKKWFFDVSEHGLQPISKQPNLAASAILVRVRHPHHAKLFSKKT